MQSKSPGDTSGRSDNPDPPKGNPARVAATKSKICDAVVLCLDEVGYSETSINRVQTSAGVSRGALTHHFPSKEAMMVETLERLLDPVRGSTVSADTESRHIDSLHKNAAQADGLEHDLARLWSKVVNTPEGRALMEILVAARTDSHLHDRIAPTLQKYNSDISRNVLKFYTDPNDQSTDISALWSICRIFMRGLHTQSPFETDPEAVSNLINRFGQIMAPHMTAKTQKQDTTDD